jgi:hypothetical protein
VEVGPEMGQEVGQEAAGQETSNSLALLVHRCTDRLASAHRLFRS